ncbi:helix-turn-helix transcriptional regulator [Cryobacterium sp. PAMC25264]|uniref:helix-turn-helix domain-containing protein n=1 Tax=Cryobacterium sp. PAMC25264 TaxID=2861288 RepID=UPI001C62C80D|nr:helix-turn-helix transcriptional regulator [Cryobacterium sp. PAMC25264]QYF72116.1 helix-turn-helix transcriptional regulator [Cryobacterium sp. PAMC25264]
MGIVINLDVELAKKKMSVTDLAAAIGLAVANVSILKNGRAKAVRFSTLDAICSVLGCQPGDILTYVPDSGEPAGDESGEA